MHAEEMYMHKNNTAYDVRHLACVPARTIANVGGLLSGLEDVSGDSTLAEEWLGLLGKDKCVRVSSVIWSC